MPDPIHDRLVKVILGFNVGDDSFVENVYHLIAGDPGPYTAADLLTVAGDFASLWAVRFITHLSNGLSLTGASAKDLGQADGAFAHLGLTPDFGTETGDMCPANVAYCISWKDGLSYRGGHARTYLAGVPASKIADPQHVTSAWRTLIQTAAQNLISDIAGHTWPAAMSAMELVSVHNRLDKVAHVPPVVPSIISAACDLRIDSQRRRLRR